MAYSFDSSAFINPWRRYYPPDVFGSLWDRIAELIEKEQIKASIEVRYELEKKDDELYAFLKRFDNLFVPLDEEQQDSVSEILTRFPHWIDVDSDKNNADPFVVALARQLDFAVVSYERSGSLESPKIPHVCRSLQVRSLNFVEFLREIRQTF